MFSSSLSSLLNLYPHLINYEIMSSPVPHSVLPYIQFGTCIYTPNTAANALLDAALQDSHLASTLDHACYVDCVIKSLAAYTQV